MARWRICLIVVYELDYISYLVRYYATMGRCVEDSRPKDIMALYAGPPNEKESPNIFSCDILFEL